MKVDVIFHIPTKWNEEKHFLMKAVRRSESKNIGILESVCSLGLAFICFSFPADSNLRGLGMTHLVRLEITLSVLFLYHSLSTSHGP